MLRQPKSAFFVIADISGYTSFLEAVELDDAQDIIADLMDTILRRLRPPFRLAKFEGDAAFVYAVSEKADGSLLQDAAECAYFAFRKRLRNIKLATTCECSACDKMQTLDLKFVCHHGEFIKHRMGGREELVGRDVILVHRLLKNVVNERLGGRAYALYSDAFVRAAGVDPTAEGLVEHKEPIHVIGDVACWLRDLEQAWLDENNRQRSEVSSDKPGAVLRFEIAAPRPIVLEISICPNIVKIAGSRRSTRNKAGGSAWSRHSQPLYAWRSSFYRGGDRLASARLPDLDDATADARRAESADDLRILNRSCGNPHRDPRGEAEG